MRVATPTLYEHYTQMTPSKQRLFQDVVNQTTFAYMMVWQEREWNDNVVTHMINEMETGCKVFREVYRRNTVATGALKRIVRDTLTTWFKQPMYVPVAAAATIAASMHVFMQTVDHTGFIQRYLIPHEAVTRLCSVEAMKRLSDAPLDKLDDELYTHKHGFKQILNKKLWDEYKFDEVRAVGVYISHHVTIHL